MNDDKDKDAFSDNPQVAFEGPPERKGIPRETPSRSGKLRPVSNEAQGDTYWLKEGQRRLEQGQNKQQADIEILKENQYRLENSVNLLQQGQKRLEEDVNSVKEGQKALQEGQNRLENSVNLLQQGQKWLEEEVNSVKEGQKVLQTDVAVIKQVQTEMKELYLELKASQLETKRRLDWVTMALVIVVITGLLSIDPNTPILNFLFPRN